MNIKREEKREIIPANEINFDGKLKDTPKRDEIASCKLLLWCPNTSDAP